MNLRAVPTLLPGVLVIESEVYADRRGCFLEHYRSVQLADLGLPAMAECDVTISQRNVLRGLHYQVRDPQGKLLRVLHGAAFVAAVDMRERSPTAGKAAWLTLDRPGRALWVPPGFASGSLALADETVLLTACSAPHRTAPAATGWCSSTIRISASRGRSNSTRRSCRIWTRTRRC